MADVTYPQTAVRKRLKVVFALTVLIMFLLISRLAWIQIVRAAALSEQAWEQWNHTMTVRSARGSIYDRHNRLLAGVTTVDTVAAVPPQVENPQVTAAELSAVLGMDADRIYELITMADRHTVYIMRKVDPEVSQAVRELNLPGITFIDEEQRYYPGGNLASQLLGFVGMDQGWSGLEFFYEDYLRGSEGRAHFLVDARQRQVPYSFSRSVTPPSGMDLRLTIDETIQHIVETELARTMLTIKPRQVMALAVDPRTGAVLAVASKPDFNPLFFDRYDPTLWNLAPFTTSYEPGSTFKMIIAAAAVEEGLFSEDEHFFCNGYTIVNDTRINCWTVQRGGHGYVSFRQALDGSCNPAFIELGIRLGEDRLFRYKEAFGFGMTTGIDYPGESAGKIFEAQRMGPLELATTSFGQGITVTPVQQVMAIASMVNGGYLLKPYLVQEMRNAEDEVIYYRDPEVVRQVISSETGQTIAEMMESIIIRGTGTSAAVEGFRVAGKTGTAQIKGQDGNYLEDYFIYSLVGFAPAENPGIILFVAMDGEARGTGWGSQTTGPLFRRIMEGILNYKQIAPSKASLSTP
ncbi:MAG TPA: penicillin-binding transpeptidase domain-containing protein [Candidatus Limnocylindrales bacterium]|nr:penicillin-binding transpeptidase domain-containing protein [Candidatus Limnocylindrales bacterium]